MWDLQGLEGIGLQGLGGLIRFNFEFGIDTV